MEIESKQQILERRKEIEQEPPHQRFWCGDKLVDILKELFDSSLAKSMASEKKSKDA